MNLGLATYLLNPVYLIVVSIAALVLYFRIGQVGFLLIGCSYSLQLIWSALLFILDRMYIDVATLMPLYEFQFYIWFLTTLLTMFGFVMLLLQHKGKSNGGT